MKSVVITGGAGYIGSGVVRFFLRNNYRVICVDRLAFGGESLLDVWNHPHFIFYHCDINKHNEFKSILDRHTIDAVIHLAAIVGDPACKREPELALQTNWLSSKWLLDECIHRKISRFIFASTCSNYGKMSDPNAYVNETSQLSPVSLYAELKVQFENYLLNTIPHTEDFIPTALRFSTVYGLSTRMRFDLTVNEFTKELTLGRELVVFGEQFWRPYCHVDDFARAFLKVLESPSEKVAYEVFNVGDTSENYTKQMLIEEIKKIIPTAQIQYVHTNDDPRDYRVNSDKIKKMLGFEISKRVPDGIKEIHDMLKSEIIANPDEQRYYNVPVS